MEVVVSFNTLSPVEETCAPKTRKLFPVSPVILGISPPLGAATHRKKYVVVAALVGVMVIVSLYQPVGPAVIE
jgi:hypothetical protein